VATRASSTGALALVIRDEQLVAWDAAKNWGKLLHPADLKKHS
jgi:hypothetical protein